MQYHNQVNQSQLLLEVLVFRADEIEIDLKHNNTSNISKESCFQSRNVSFYFKGKIVIFLFFYRNEKTGFLVEVRAISCSSPILKNICEQVR